MSVKFNLSEQIQSSSENEKSITSKDLKANIDDVDKFSRLMRKDENNDHSFDENNLEQKMQGQKTDDSFELSSIFSALIQGKEPQEKIEKPSKISQQDLSSAQKIADDLLERILVSDKKLDGSVEVKLLLNDSSILKQTEISINRDLNGMLFVNISSSDNNSYQKLLSSKAILEKQLNDKEDNPVRVEVVFNEDFDKTKESEHYKV